MTHQHSNLIASYAQPAGTLVPYAVPGPHEAWLDDLHRQTGIPDSRAFALESQLARRVRALLAFELRLAWPEFEAQGVSPSQAPFAIALTRFLDTCDPARWRPSTDAGKSDC